MTWIPLDLQQICTCSFLAEQPVMQCLPLVCDLVVSFDMYLWKLSYHVNTIPCSHVAGDKHAIVAFLQCLGS